VFRSPVYIAEHNDMVEKITFVAAIARRRNGEITKYKLMFQD
jgi:hypothetical protein